ncbi:circadian clock KaiB family protein [Cyanobium sp. FGCU-52]|nr:circadian clock KaiB family protein [Cyanobium sp. FGCU52]
MPSPMPDRDPPGEDERWDLTLYVIRGSILSSNAIATIRRLCSNELAGRSDLHIVDIHQHPEALEADGILAVPSLVKRRPAPRRLIVGDLSSEDRVREALSLPPGRALPQQQKAAEAGHADGSGET